LPACFLRPEQDFCGGAGLEKLYNVLAFAEGHAVALLGRGRGTVLGCLFFDPYFERDETAGAVEGGDGVSGFIVGVLHTDEGMGLAACVKVHDEAVCGGDEAGGAGT